jgi:hypothetical protein
MGVDASLTIDCDGNVVLVIANSGAQGFHGQYATASSWIGDASVAAGASRTVTAHINGLNPTVSGYVQGTMDDSTPVRVPFSGTKAASCAPYVPPTTVVDLTPQPIPTTAPGQVQLCRVPGSNPPMSVPCDDPRATQPYQPVPVTAAPTPDAPPVTEAPVAAEPAPVVTGPPRHTVHASTHATTAEVRPSTLPVTGPSLLAPELGVLGALFVLGFTCLRIVRPRRG